MVPFCATYASRADPDRMPFGIFKITCNKIYEVCVNLSKQCKLVKYHV